MDTMQNPYQPARPRRRRKTKIQIFKETQLPVIIAGLALLTILIFIIGAASRSGTKKADDQANKISAAEKAEEQQRLGCAAYHTITEEWSAETAAERFVALAQRILDGEKYPEPYVNGPCSRSGILGDDWFVHEK